MNFLRCKNTNLIFLFRILSNAFKVYYVLLHFETNNTVIKCVVRIKLISFDDQL